jgi:hypothetical protein
VCCISLDPLDLTRRSQPGFITLDTKEAAWQDTEDASKVYKIRSSRGVVKAPTMVGAGLS